MDKIKQERKENGINSYTESNSYSNDNLANFNDDINDQDRQDTFLRAFGKPTQIYRFLRTRHSISPVFLHRTLFYMKFRVSRDHTKRSSLSIDEITDNLRRKKELEASSSKFGNLVIRFSGIQDKTLDNKSQINVTVFLSKNKNELLNGSSGNEIKIGECRLTHTSDGLSNSKLTVPKEYFKLNAKNILIFKVQISRQIISSSNNNHQTLTNGNSNGDYDVIIKEENNNSHNKKRKTVHTETVKYRGELNMGSSHDCVLKDGEYSLSLTEYSSCSSNNLNNINNNLVYGLDRSDNIEDRFKKIVFWESANQLTSHYSTLKDVTQEPLLTFYLNWTNDLNETGHNQSIKPYLNGKNNQQPLKQIDPPNTEYNNKLSFSKNSKRYQNNSLHTNGNTNGATNGSSNGFTTDTSNCNGPVFLNSFLTNGHSNHHSVDHLENGNSFNSSQVIYRFIYNNQILQQTRASGDFRCPWCALNCLQFFSLKGHLKFYHSRLNFKFTLDNKGYKVDVTVNEAFDGSYCLNPHLDLINFNSLATNGPQQRTQVTHILTCLKGKAKRKLLSECLKSETAEFDIFRTQTIGHDRLYYHSRTLQPIKPHEMNDDSEDEIDPEWMRKKTQLMIDEFSDVNEGEKEVMKLWNLHMMKYNFVGGCHVPLACEMFIKENWKEIVRRKIYMNFVLHLNNLFDYGLLTSSNLREIINLFHRIKNDGSASNGTD